MIWGITLILLSIIAVPSLLISKKPDAKELLEKVEPYQGWIGLIFCFWGAMGIITAVLNLGWLTSVPNWSVTFLAGNTISTALGIMLGSGLINKLFLSKSDVANAKATELRDKIAPKQGKIGIVGILVGIWMIIASFMWTVT